MTKLICNIDNKFIVDYEKFPVQENQYMNLKLIVAIFIVLGIIGSVAAIRYSTNMKSEAASETVVRVGGVVTKTSVLDFIQLDYKLTDTDTNKDFYLVPNPGSNISLSQYIGRYVKATGETIVGRISKFVKILFVQNIEAGINTAITPLRKPSLIPQTGIAIGIYEPSQGTSGRAIDRYINEAGRKPAFAWLPMTWQNSDGSYRQFDTKMLDQFRTRNIMPGLTWEPSKGPAQTAGPNQPDFSWKQISSGRYDSYINQFAHDAASYRYPFILRILHEMDGTWYPWGYGVNGNTNIADYVTAYKHIVDIFRAAGANNIQFVWNPNVINATTIQKYGEMLKQAYPGDNYVDWVALDGYNNKLDNWQSLLDVFQPIYQLITSFSDRPMMLFEVGSIENPADPMAKANWITQGFLTTIPNQFPKIKVVVYFNSTDGSGRDFSLQTSPNSVTAWKQVVTSPLYQGSLLK